MSVRMLPLRSVTLPAPPTLLSSGCTRNNAPRRVRVEVVRNVPAALDTSRLQRGQPTVVSVPLQGVPAATWALLEDALAAARIDQTLILALIAGGFGGTDLARHLAPVLLDHLQRTEPVAAEWTTLVLQALRDPREVWEPGYLSERARLRTHLLAFPCPLLRGLYLRLLRPWSLPPRVWQQRLARLPADGSLPWPVLRALRDEPAAVHRRDAPSALQQVWREGWQQVLPEAILSRCLARARQLNRREPGLWEPLVAIDVLREHQHGSRGLDALLRHTHLRTAPRPPAVTHPLACLLLQVAEQARCISFQEMPPAGSGAARRALALCGLLVLPARAGTGVPPPASPPTAATSAAAVGEVAPWPLPVGTHAGALTATGTAPWSSTFAMVPCVAAVPAGPPVVAGRGSGLRPEEALTTVASRFTAVVSARWLGVSGQRASDFNSAVHALLHKAGVTPAERLDPEGAVNALFERGDACVADSLSAIEVPLFARRLVERASASTRLYLLTLGLSRVFARIQPRVPGDPEMQEAAQWMCSVDDYFRAQISHAAVRASVNIGEARRWLPDLSTATEAAVRSCAQAVADAWNPQFRPAPSLAWPYGSPQYRSSGWFTRPAPPADRPTLVLAGVVFSLANPVLEAIKQDHDPLRLPRLNASDWQQQCERFAQAQTALDASTCMQIAWHRIARQLQQFDQRRHLIDASEDSLHLRAQLRRLILPLHRAVEALPDSCADTALHARARRSMQQFLSMVRQHQQLHGRNATAVADSVRSAFPGSDAALPAVLSQLLAQTGFPDADDVEATFERLYTGNATQALISRVLEAPPKAVDSVVVRLFFARLAQAPLPTATQTPALLEWQQQLRLRAAPGMLRGEWIERLSPAQAAALFENDDRPGLQALLDEALAIPAHAAQRWRLRQQAPQRLAAWLQSTAGQRRMAEVLGRPEAGTRFLFDDSGLPSALGLALLDRAVRHHLDDASWQTLQPMLAQARTSRSPLLSLAVTLRARFPLLTAAACLTHAAVLLAPVAQWEEPAPFDLQFPLPALSANITSPALSLTGLLRVSGMDLLEQLEPALPAWQAWDLLASTAGFQHAAQRLSGNRTTPAAAQQAVARWMLDHGIGKDTVARLVAGLDDATAREQGMLATREQLQAHLPALPWAQARQVLWWLLVHHAGRPEWAVADLPDDLDYGRSLRSVAFLQAVGLCDAAAPGTAAALSAGYLAELPARLSATTGPQDETRRAAWLDALVRPALLYAAAHQHLHLPNGTAQATTAQAQDAMVFVRERQAALARAAGQLLRSAPQRRPLAAAQLRQAGIAETYWNQTLDQIPSAVLNAGGVIRRAMRDTGLDGMSLVLGTALRGLEEALLADSLQELLVGGAVELVGHPSIAQVFDQAYALYREQMTEALAELLTRSLDGLPVADRRWLQQSTVTPLLVPGATYGVLLRCEPSARAGTRTEPTYLAVIPAAGYAARLLRGDRRINGQWQTGLLYPHESFVTGIVPDRNTADALQLLEVAACTVGRAHHTAANATAVDDGLLQAMAELMYGDFFTRTRDAELARLTRGERLEQTEAAVADSLARFAIPFYGCVRDLTTRDYNAAVVDCTLDALTLLQPEAGIARFLRTSTELVVHAGELSVRALLHDAGAAVLRLGEDLAAQSGLQLLHDLGRGVVRIGRDGARWLLQHVPAMESRLLPALEATGSLRSAAALDRRLLEQETPAWFSAAEGCVRVRRQVPVGRCTGEAITLFDFAPSPAFDTPGEVTWFAGMQVASDEPLTGAGRRFIVDGEYWLQTAAADGYQFTREASHAVPELRPRIRATLVGGESQLVRVELHNPYPDHLLRITQGAVIGRARDGSRVLITRVAPGRFYLATWPADAEARAGLALEFWPLELQGFAPAQNDAVKTAWWGAFHYSQQCQLSGAALVDRFGSQLQRQLEQLDDLDRLLQDVRANSPYAFHNLPAQAVMSCAQSNCRYVQALRQQIGPAHWRAPRADDAWIDEALRDLLNPPGAAPTAVFTTLDDTLEARFLTPRRGPPKTLALAQLTLKDDPLPRLFHATSGQRRGRSLLPLSNLQPSNAPAGWQIDGTAVTTPRARYIDAQPSATSIAQGEVSSVVPNHSLHADDLDGRLFHERNARHLDAERNLYYRIERYISEGSLDPAEVTAVRLFSSRKICASCHISVGSLRARFPGAQFDVVEREVRAAATPLDRAAPTGS